MRANAPSDVPATCLRAELRALAAAVLLFAGILASISSCGNGDLVFPGQALSTPTSQFTDTPGPTETP